LPQLFVQPQPGFGQEGQWIEGCAAGTGPADDEQHGDDEDVLQQEDREGRLAGVGSQQAPIHQFTQAHGRGGHRNGQCGDQPHGRIRVVEGGKGPDHCGCRHVLGQAEADDPAPHRPQRRRIQFQPEQEQQQHHPEFGEVAHQFRVDAHPRHGRMQRQPYQQVAHQAPEPQLLAERRRDCGCGQEDEGFGEHGVV